MCPQCEFWADFFCMRSLDTYSDVVREVAKWVDDGRLALVEATCPLREVRPITPLQPWGDREFNYIEHVTRCAACGQEFRLAVWVLGASKGPGGGRGAPGAVWMPIERVRSQPAASD